MKNLDTPPRWDLTSIYPSVDSPEFAAAVADFEKQLDGLEHFVTSIPAETVAADAVFSDWLYGYFQRFNNCGALYSSLSSYAGCVNAVDTTDTAGINSMAKLDEIAVRLEQIEISFRAILSAHADKLPFVFEKYPQLAHYDFVLREELMFFKKQLSPELEKLASDLRRTGSDAWSRLQEQIISNLTDPSCQDTFNKIRNDAYSPDPLVRKTAFERETNLLRSVEIPLAAALNSIKGTTVTLNKRAGWESALAKSRSLSRISQKTLASLLAAIENSLPFWRDYLKTKATLLGKPELPFYDLFAPLPENTVQSNQTVSQKSGRLPLVSKKWTFAEARSYIIEKFLAFSPDLGNFADMAFKNGWIDAEIRRGKVGGAFCTDFPFHKQTRVLSNFSGSFSDITTLAHELGHAYHQFCIQEKDYALIHYPMTLAETASNFCETIVQKDVMANADGFDRVSITEMHLQDSCQVLVDILSRFYFERAVFERRCEGELSAADFCTLMLEAQEKTYGNGLSQKHPYMWAVKGHYYSPHLDFYNFPYAFGLLFASALYGRFLREGKSFCDVYKTLLQETGRFSCEKLCKRAGFNIETEEFWASGIALFEPELAALKAIV